MKNIKKILGVIALTVGFACLSLLDSDIPLWGTLLLVVTGMAGFLGGAALWCAGSDEPLVD